MQGNCSGAPQFDLPPLDPPLAQERRQCLIYVREDFLETPLQDSHLWLSNLYVTMPGVEKNHSTLIGAHGGDVYMTDMTFVADGDKARAVDVKEGRRVYIAGALTTSRRCHRQHYCHRDVEHMWMARSVLHVRRLRRYPCLRLCLTVVLQVVIDVA